MKNRLLLAAAFAAIGTTLASADVFELSMGDQWGSADCNLTEWEQEGFTFSPAKGENAKDKVPVYKQKNKEVRFYALNTLTITAPSTGEPMTELVFTLSKQGREEQAVIMPSAGQTETQTVGNSTVVWRGSAHSLTLTVGETNSLHPEGIVDGSGQFDFSKIRIVTGNAGVSKPQDTDSEVYMCNAAPGDGVLTEWTQGNLRFTAKKGADETVNDPTLKNDEEARFYAGNSLTLSTIDGRVIASLEFVLSEQGLEQQAALTPSSGTVEQSQGTNVVWSGEANTVTFAVGTNGYGTKPSKKGQFDFTAIRIRYAASSGVVDSIAGDDGSGVEYYDLQGTRVDRPTHSGIFIRRHGNKAEKVLVAPGR